MFEDQVLNVTETGEGNVEVVRHIQTMGGEVAVKEVVDARQYFEKQATAAQGGKQVVFERLVDFMNAISNQDYDKADEAIQQIMASSDASLFKEVG